MSLKKLQQQLARNRGKTTVLGALTIVLVVMGLKAFQSLQPQHASAISPPRSAASEAPHAAPDADLDKRARESLALWNLLREKRGLEASVAYHFDPSYYNLDPAKQREHDAQQQDRIITQVPEKPTQNPTDQDMTKAHETHIRDLARGFVVQTTILGPDPKALITVAGSSHVVRLNEVIDGFKIVAIDGREVRIQREGVTFALKRAPIDARQITRNASATLSVLAEG